MNDIIQETTAIDDCVAVLLDLEKAPDEVGDPHCAVCGDYHDDHDDDCRLDRALTRAGYPTADARDKARKDLGAGHTPRHQASRPPDPERHEIGALCSALHLPVPHPLEHPVSRRPLVSSCCTGYRPGPDGVLVFDVTFYCEDGTWVLGSAPKHGVKWTWRRFLTDANPTVTKWLPGAASAIPHGSGPPGGWLRQEVHVELFHGGSKIADGYSGRLGALRIEDGVMSLSLDRLVQVPDGLSPDMLQRLILNREVLEVREPGAGGNPGSPMLSTSVFFVSSYWFQRQPGAELVGRFELRGQAPEMGGPEMGGDGR